MTSTTLPIFDYTVAVTNNGVTASFTFRVSKQPATTGQIISFGSSYDRHVMTFLVRDVTSYSGTNDPLTKFGTLFTTMLISALRKLIFETGSIIPKPGDSIVTGANYASVVDTVDISQAADKTTDVFVVTCHVKEPVNVNISVTDDETPKFAKLEDLPPWQEGAQLSFSSATTEGMTLGFAFPTIGLDSSKTYTNVQLRMAGLAKTDRAVPVVNTAGDPFSSPPSMPKVNGTLSVTRAYLKASGTIDLSSLQGVVNLEEILLNVLGAKLWFPTGTLSPTNLSITPKIYKAPIPWFPKTKHPLGKTYGDLFYGYSKMTANKVAVNRTSATIAVQKPIKYLEVNATFSFRPEGFGVWIANRGFAEKDASARDGLKSITDDNGVIKESWLDPAGKKTSDKKLWKGFTNFRSSTAVKTLLEAFLNTVPGDFSWATEKDNFGEKIK